MPDRGKVAGGLIGTLLFAAQHCHTHCSHSRDRLPFVLSGIYSRRSFRRTSSTRGSSGFGFDFPRNFAKTLKSLFGLGSTSAAWEHERVAGGQVADWVAGAERPGGRGSLSRPTRPRLAHLMGRREPQTGTEETRINSPLSSVKIGVPSVASFPSLPTPALSDPGYLRLLLVPGYNSRTTCRSSRTCIGRLAKSGIVTAGSMPRWR